MVTGPLHANYHSIPHGGHQKIREDVDKSKEIKANKITKLMLKILEELKMILVFV